MYQNTSWFVELMCSSWLLPLLLLFLLLLVDLIGAQVAQCSMCKYKSAHTEVVSLLCGCIECSVHALKGEKISL